MCYTALVLTMIFSMGEQVPYHHYGSAAPHASVRRLVCGLKLSSLRPQST